MRNTTEIAKYALLGAQSVGKTTIADFFKQRFVNKPHVAVLEEAARVFFDTNPQITDRSYATQLAIQNFALRREKELYKPGTEIIISDRSVVDPIVLAQIWDPENAQKLLDNVSDWLQTYTLFLILDLTGVPSKPGPHRKETPEQRLTIQNKFINFCIINNLAYEFISGSLDQRIKRIEQLINSEQT